MSLSDYAIGLNSEAKTRYFDKLNKVFGYTPSGSGSKLFFKYICCATLVRWATPTTPRRTNFYMD